MPSVIVPAHNEASVIARTIDSVLADRIDDLEVVVVANGCSDDTADRARRFGERVRVIELSEPGKCNAINQGEKAVDGFPRAYVDGDIELGAGALTRLFAALGSSVHLTSATLHYDLRDVTVPARLAYMVERHNRYFFGTRAPNGSGVFVVSETGRARWDAFPDVINDDGFAALHFEPTETEVVEGALVTVRPPRSLRALIPPRARSRRGTNELIRLYPELSAANPSHVGSVLRAVAFRPWLWPGGVCYASVKVAERVAAARSESTGELAGWNQDRSTRQ